LQLGPTEVTASAPGGTESSSTWTVGGAALKASMENDEQPPRTPAKEPARTPATAIAMTRRMIDP
jgi:hypothetical protein